MKLKPALPYQSSDPNNAPIHSPTTVLLSSQPVKIPSISSMKNPYEHRRVVMTECLKTATKSSIGTSSSSSSSVGSGTESPIDEEVLHRSHSSPSSSLDSDIGSDNPDEHESLLRSNPGSGGLFDEANIRRVNLNAAFHDHLTLTKLNHQLRQSNTVSSSFPFHHPDHLDHPSDPSPVSSCVSNDKDQIDFLQDMVVTQLDLIDYQKEQNQKKDRQLLGLKQEREKLMSQLERIEKRCNLLNRKLSMYESCSIRTADGPHSMKSKTLTTSEPTAASLEEVLHNVTKSCTVFSNHVKQHQSPSSSQMLLKQQPNNNQDLMFKDQAVQVTPDMIRRSKSNLTGSSATLSSSKKKKLSQSLNQSLQSQVAAAITSRGNSIDESSAGQLHQQPAKKKQRSASIPVRIIDDEGDSCESLCPASPAQPITILLPKDFLCTTEEYEVVNMRELDVPRLKKQIDVLTPDCDTGTSSIRTPKLSQTSFESSPFFTENGISRIKNTSELIEVPSFRILNFTPLTVCDEDDDEMLDDDTFNRRHAKLEIDERRRKRSVCALRLDNRLTLFLQQVGHSEAARAEAHGKVETGQVLLEHCICASRCQNRDNDH